VLRVIELWTDGSGSTGDAPAGWAFVLRHVDAGGKISDLLNGGRLERGTNNVAELTAVIEGLRALKRSCSLTIVTDSEYVMKGFTEDRVADWRKRGWKTAAGKPVANQDLWEALAAEVVQHDDHLAPRARPRRPRAQRARRPGRRHDAALGDRGSERERPAGRDAWRVARGFSRTTRSRSLGAGQVDNSAVGDPG
jgi:ribonuclease HI